MNGTPLTAPKPADAGRGLDGETLKLIAILAMTVDHIAFAFVPDGTAMALVMHAAGRVTGPVMFYMAAEGCRHTRSIPRYVLRLAAFALVSYLPFQLFCYGGAIFSRFTLTRLNVVYTILLGVLAVWARHGIRPMPLKVLLTGGLVLLGVPGDWGTTGVLMILTFDFYYGDFRNQAFGYVLVVLLGQYVLHLFTSPVFGLIYDGAPDFSAWQYGAENLGLFLPLALLRRYSGERGSRGRWGKWLFYIYYPAHLLVLGLLRVFTGL